MLLKIILAVLLFKAAALALPHKTNEIANDASNEEFVNFFQKLGLGQSLKDSESLTVLITGNNSNQMVNERGEQLNKTVQNSLLLHGQSSLGEVQSMIRRARDIFEEKLISSMSKDTSPSDFKDGSLLTIEDPQQSNETGSAVRGQSSVTVNYHHNPSVVQFNFFNRLPSASRNSCDPNPCQNGGLCKLDESGKIDGYYCKCPTPMGGKNCSEVQCGSLHCFFNGKIVIYVYNDKAITFDSAKKHCERRNMRLVKIPDEDTNEFVRRALLKMYANDHTSQHCFFNGLYRSTSKGTFYWTDGTPLGNYRPWSSGKLEGQCVVLCTTTKFYFYWDVDPCDGEDSMWEYYHICERKLSF